MLLQPAVGGWDVWITGKRERYTSMSGEGLDKACR